VPAARSSTFCPGPIRSAAREARRQYRSWPSDSTVLVRSYRASDAVEHRRHSRGSLSKRSATHDPDATGSVLAVPALDVFLADPDLLAAFVEGDGAGGRREVFTHERERHLGDRGLRQFGRGVE